MAKHRSKWNEKPSNVILRKDVVKGTLKDYKPWIGIPRTFTSLGVFSPVKSNKDRSNCSSYV